MMRSLLVLLVVAGCAEPADPIEPQVTSGAIRKRIPIAINRDIDILFVIDNSSAMAPVIDNVRANLGRFIATLRAIPSGFPALRLGVVTTNPTDDGVLRGTSGLAGTFAIDVVGPDGERVRNYEGDLAAVFERLGDVGTAGGTAAPLTAIRRAFENPANSNFRRPHAFIGVFVISASDDRAELVAETEQYLKMLPGDPSKVIVGGALGDTPQLRAFLDRFPNRTTHAAIADPDWAKDVFALVAQSYRTSLAAPCIEGPLFDLDLATPGLQPACAVWYTFPIGGEVLRPCIDGLNGQCWQIVENRAVCGEERLFAIRQQRLDFPDEAMLELDCLTRQED